MPASMPLPSDKQIAKRRISIFLAHHGLGTYHSSSDEEFAAQARCLMQLRGILRDGDISQVIQDLQKDAEEIAQMELNDLFSNGHRDRVADQIRRVANELEQDLAQSRKVVDEPVHDLEDDPAYEGCPWRLLRPRLARYRVPAALADVLWKKNSRRAQKWTVTLEEIGLYVWGDEAASQGKISTNKTRLKDYLKEWGVVLELTIHGKAQTPYMQCSVESVDKEKIEEALSLAEKSQTSPREQKAVFSAH